MGRWVAVVGGALGVGGLGAALVLLLVVTLVLSALAGVLFLAATGLVNVPFLSGWLGTDAPRDLGVRGDPLLFRNLLERTGVSLNGAFSQFCLTCDIRYSDPRRMDVTLTSEELSSYLQATNDGLGPLRDVQVRLLDGNQAEISATLDLRGEGVDWAGPVYGKGTVVKGSSNTVKISLDEAQAGVVGVPEGVRQRAQGELEDMVNSQLGKMTGLEIEGLSIEDGLLHFEGVFPHTISGYGR
jgi:hypothetical protein